MILSQSFLTTLVYVIGLLAVRHGLIRAIRRKSDVLSKDQRTWISRIRNMTIILLLIGFVLIWAPQLHSLALSLAAVAIAVVVATKEMILCLMGALMRVTTTPFRIGDWITIDGVSGEVVDINAFSFRVQEIDIAGKSYRPTGRVVEIPNGKLFTSNTENLTFIRKYVFIEVPVIVTSNHYHPGLLETIEGVAAAHYEPFAEGARKYNRSFEKKTGMDIPDPDPVVTMWTTDIGNINYLVKAFVPTDQASTFYRHIVSDILEHVYAEEGDKTLKSEKTKPSSSQEPDKMTKKIVKSKKS